MDLPTTAIASPDISRVQVRHALVVGGLRALLWGVGTFQVALAAGLPWGAAAWGGTHQGVLPPGLRVASAVSAMAWGAGGFAVGRIGPSATPRQRKGLWVLAGIGTVATVMNLASPSPLERAIWVPVSAAMAVLATIVARRH